MKRQITGDRRARKITPALGLQSQNYKHMKPFSRILVGLDFTPMDSVLIGFMCQFLRINPFINKIYFIHATRDLQNKSWKKNMQSEGAIPNDELFKLRMREEVEKCYKGNKKVEVHYEIVEGDPIAQLRRWSEIKYIDLIIAGKKIKTQGSGLVMEKLARKSNCSILLVPENYPRRFRKILIPADFSRRTDTVLEVIGMISKYLPGTKFICLHVVDVPYGYTKIGKTYKEFADIMLTHAQKKWRHYERSHGIESLNIEPVFIFNENGSIAKSIINYAHSNHVDIIFLGSKKQTDASVFLLGSVGEELITRDKDILLLIVKDKQKHYDFFTAMGKL